EPGRKQFRRAIDGETHGRAIRRRRIHPHSCQPDVPLWGRAVEVAIAVDDTYRKRPCWSICRFSKARAPKRSAVNVGSNGKLSWVRPNWKQKSAIPAAATSEILSAISVPSYGRQCESAVRQICPPSRGKTGRRFTNPHQRLRFSNLTNA